MRFAQVFAIVASVASVAYANDDEEATTTMTSTTTRTITVTQCNPTVTNCPARNSSAIYPMTNATSTYSPSGTGPVTVIVVPTSTSTKVVTAATTAPSTVATAGSSNLFVQGSVLLGAIGLGLAAVI